MEAFRPDKRLQRRARRTRRMAQRKNRYPPCGISIAAGGRRIRSGDLSSGTFEDAQVLKKFGEARRSETENKPTKQAIIPPSGLKSAVPTRISH
jgi:hypothetical protein